MQPIIHCVPDLDGPSFERFLLSAVEAYHCHQRLDTGRSRFVGLQIHVHVLALIEHASHAGNQLLPIPRQRVASFAPVFILRCIVKCVPEIYALAAQHDGT